MSPNGAKSKISDRLSELVSVFQYCLRREI